MKHTLRTELHKALTNKMLYIAIAFGLIFCAMDVMENIGKIREFDQRIANQILGLRLSTDHQGYSLFYLWMGIQPNTRGANLFHVIWPVMAGMAYGWSYASERRSGVYNQIAARSGARTYYVSKYIAVFASGGLAVAVPFLLNLLANAMVLPYAHISPYFNQMSNVQFLSQLYYTNHWVYALVRCVIVFLCGGVAASLCFLVGTKLRYGVMVMLTPYAVYVAWDAVIIALNSSVLQANNYCLSPLRMLPGAGMLLPGWLMLCILGGLTLISFGVGYWQVVKHELA